MAIAWRVGELAERRGLRTRELAEKASLDVKTVRNIVNGRATRVDLDTIDRLSSALGVTPGELWYSSGSSGGGSRMRMLMGIAGEGRDDEIDWALGRGPDPFGLLDPGLERALREV